MLSRPRPILLALSLTVLAGCAADEATTGPARLLEESSVNLALIPGQVLPLPPGYTSGYALDIANNGDVVGGATYLGSRVDGYHYNGSTGAVTALSPSFGWDSWAEAVFGGNVALNSYTGSKYLPYRWSNVGGYVPVVLPPSAVHGYLAGIGSGGVVGGWVARADLKPRAFKNDANGSTLLNPAGADSSKVISVASNGYMAGWAAYGGQLRAAAWIAGVTYVRLPQGSDDAAARGINNKGEIVVVEFSLPGTHSGKVFRWVPAKGTYTRLAPLGDHMTPYDVSNKGRIAGFQNVSGVISPVSFRNGVLQLLTTPFGTGFALAVNACGDQAGYVSNGGLTQPVLWRSFPCDP
ncbi:MAG: hypothetical protein IPK85_22950 [Gemmatimonadetes bacterium]|nr:hypothetical protein [Gemmatimonadota bacterium]